MKNLKSLKDLRIYFIGIGGVSMSGLCILAKSRGAIVMGSDVYTSAELDNLKAKGIHINIGHKAENIHRNIDLVVYTSAVSDDNPELVRAKELCIPTMCRAEFLGIIASYYKKVIAISGTHGKTTTTSIISEILRASGLNPTIHIGGKSIGLQNNTMVGDNNILVVEACEYKESFRFLKPFIGVITNIEFDHPDYYPDMQHLKLAFQNFANNCECLVSSFDCGISHSQTIFVFKDFEVKNIESIGGGYNFNVFHMGEFYHSFRINVLGYHNVVNSLFAIAVAHKLGVSKETIEKALADFQGVERRYECIKTYSSGCRVIIDYAHHPTELKNSIEGLQDVYKNILYVFQPHTYTRTLKLFDEFIEVLSSLQYLVLYKTYPARENVIAGGTAKDLYVKLDNKNKYYFDEVNKLELFLKEKSVEFDCILILGAGSLADILKRNFCKYINYC